MSGKNLVRAVVQLPVFFFGAHGLYGEAPTWDDCQCVILHAQPGASVASPPVIFAGQKCDQGRVCAYDCISRLLSNYVRTTKDFTMRH